MQVIQLKLILKIRQVVAAGIIFIAAALSHGALAQPATIEGDKVIIPTLSFESVYYTLHLQVMPNTGNQYFSLPYAEINNSPILENASSLNFGHTINVPHLSYAGQSYAVEFVITKQNPLTVKLNSVVTNPPVSSGADNPNNIDLNNLLSSSATTNINLHSFASSLSTGPWKPLYARGFQSMIEIIVGEPCATSDAGNFRIEAASMEEIILDEQGKASFSLADFDKVDVFYSEPGRPETNRGGYCPPLTSADWTSMTNFLVYEGDRIAELDFTNPRAGFETYHAANHGGLIYQFGTDDQIYSGLSKSTRFSTQKVTDLSIQITADDNGTYYKDSSQAQNDDSASAAIRVSFIDYDGSEISLAGEVESTAGQTRSWTPLLPTGPGLTGCWEEADREDDAWCFFSDGTGQFIQDSINGNPGTLYISFGYEANVSAGVLTYRNNHIRLVGSCCDKEETLNENTETESFSLNRNVFRIGGKDYIFTAKNLAF